MNFAHKKVACSVFVFLLPFPSRRISHILVSCVFWPAARKYSGEEWENSLSDNPGTVNLYPVDPDSRSQGVGGGVEFLSCLIEAVTCVMPDVEGRWPGLMNILSFTVMNLSFCFPYSKDRSTPFLRDLRDRCALVAGGRGEAAAVLL